MTLLSVNNSIGGVSAREQWDGGLGACCVQLLFRTAECLWMCTHINSIVNVKTSDYAMTTMTIEACASHSVSRKSSEYFLVYSFV